MYVGKEGLLPNCLNRCVCVRVCVRVCACVHADSASKCQLSSM